MAHHRTHALVVPPVSPLDFLRRRQTRLRLGESRRASDRGFFDLGLLDTSRGDHGDEPCELGTRLREAAFDRRTRGVESLEFRGQARVLRFRVGDLDTQRVSAPAPVRRALLGGTQAIAHLGFPALVLDVRRLCLIHLRREASDSSLRFLMSGFCAPEAALPFAIVDDELVENTAAPIDLRRELRDPYFSLLAIVAQSCPLIDGDELLALEHFETRPRLASRRARLEQRLLSISTRGLHLDQSPSGRLAFALVKLDRRRELRVTLVERAALGSDSASSASSRSSLRRASCSSTARSSC